MSYQIARDLLVCCEMKYIWSNRYSNLVCRIVAGWWTTTQADTGKKSQGKHNLTLTD